MNIIAHVIINPHASFNYKENLFYYYDIITFFGIKSIWENIFLFPLCISIVFKLSGFDWKNICIVML